MSVSSIPGSGYTPAVRTDPNLAGSQAAGPQSVRDEFKKIAEMTPAQRMRAMMLSDLGVTEDDLKNMSAEARQAIEQKVKEMIKQRFEQDTEKKTGQITDISV